MNQSFSDLFKAAREGRSIDLVSPPIPRKPSADREYRDALYGLARQLHAEAKAFEEPIWHALKQHDGAIVADYIQIAPKKWRMAGEFADIPKRLLKRPGHLDPNKTRVTGNLDQVAQAARISEQELKDFLRTRGRKATFTDALREAEEIIAEQRAYYD